MQKNHFAVLGLDVSATTHEIEGAYKKLRSEMHPDKNPNSDAAQRFHEVQQAYEILRDSKTRKRHAMELRHATTEDPLELARDYLASILQPYRT